MALWNRRTLQERQSLFSNRPSACRKLHNIGRSVVLFDKVFAACEALYFPKAAEECSLIGDETHAVLVKKWMDKDGRNRGRNSDYDEPKNGG